MILPKIPRRSECDGVPDEYAVPAWCFEQLVAHGWKFTVVREIAPDRKGHGYDNLRVAATTDDPQGTGYCLIWSEWKQRTITQTLHMTAWRLYREIQAGKVKDWSVET